MIYKQNVLLKKPGGKLLKSGDEKGVARFEDDGKKKLKVSIIGATDKKLYLRYASGNFSATFDYPLSRDAEFFLPDDALPGGGILIFDDAKTPILYGAFSKNAKSADEMLAESYEEKYDDEVVATENYYEYEKATAKNANNQLIWGLIDDERQFSDNKNEMFKEADNEKNQASGKKSDAYENEDAENGYGEVKEPGESYYKKIQGELNKLFENEREENLSAVVKDSKWVKIAYGEGKHYVVGVISEKGYPRWICYGVPGRYGERPQEIKDYCSFIPSSLFALKGSGYWVMYQDAESGDIV